MPLGSSKLAVNKQKFNTGAGDRITISITQSFSGNTAFNVYDWDDSMPAGVQTTNDFDTITYNLNTNRANTLFAYNIVAVEGTISTSDFSDNLLTGNVTTDSNGDASIVKTITDTTGSGHKKFQLKIVRPTNLDSVFITSATTHLYEMIPFDISGGNVSTTGVTANTNAIPGAKVIGGTKLHEFTTAGNTTVNVTSYGNYEGNANLWHNQYFVDTQPEGANVYAYWNNGFMFRSLIAGSGGSSKIEPQGESAGGGGGELGILEYGIANISPGTYTFTVGAGANNDSTGNTTIFNGNATLQKTAIYGGNGAYWVSGASNGARAGAGGSGGGGYNRDESQNRWYGNFASIGIDGETDLAYKNPHANATNLYKEHVVFANGNDGGSAEYPFRVPQFSGDGGGGAGGKGGAELSSANDEYNFYGHPVAAAGTGSGGRGIEFARTAGTLPGPYNITGLDPAFKDAGVNITDKYSYGQAWYETPLFNGERSSIQTVCAGGIEQFGSDVTGTFGNATGENGSDGAITLIYPYRDNYRFISDTEIT